jgi:hypothetical protein
MYENCGLEGEYDQKKVETVTFVCRLCEVDVWKSGVNVRVTEFEEWKNEVNARVSALETALNAVSECVAKMGMSVEAVKEDSVKVVKEESVSVRAQQAETVERMNGMGESVTEIHERVGKLGDKLGEVEGTLAEMGVKQLGFEELLQEVPELWSEVVSRKKLKETKQIQCAGQSAGTPRATVTPAAVDEVVDVAVVGGAGEAQLSNGPSFAEQCAGYKEGTVLLVGSSLARGVGQHLKADNLMFDRLDFSGARIEHIREKISVLGDRPASHVVIMAGTNNLETDGIDVMMKKYSELVDVLKKQKYREVSIVALLKRGDWRLDGKILQINRRLKALCESHGIGFVAAEIDSRRMLGRDGVHLNWRGCECVARAIFKHSCKCLNLG